MSDRQVNISQIDGVPSGSTPVVLGSPSVPIDNIYLDKLNGTSVSGLFSQTGITDRLNISNLMFRMANYDYQNNIEMLDLVGGQLNIFKDSEDIVETNNVVVKTLDEGHPNGVAELIPQYSTYSVNMENLSFKILEDVDFGNLESNIYSFTFNNDGSKLYTVGGSNNIRQFSLGDAFDVRTMTYDDVFYPILNIKDIQWSVNGDRLFVIGTNEIIELRTNVNFDIGGLYEYNRMDLPSSSFENSAWSPDGTKLIIQRSNIIYEFTLSVPFDTTTLTYTNNTVTTFGGVTSMKWSDDGMKLFISYSDGKLRTYTVEEAYSIYYFRLFNTSFGLENIQSFVFHDNGKNILVIDNNLVFREYKLPSNYKISNVNRLDGKTGLYSYTSSGNDYNGLEWSSDGRYIYIGVNGVDDILQYEAEKPFSMEKLSFTGEVLSRSFTFLRDLHLTENGEYMFVLDATFSGHVELFKLNNPFMLSDNTYIGQLTLPSTGNGRWQYHSLSVDEINKKIYVSQTYSRNINKYGFSEFDISSAILESTISTSNIHLLKFNRDGSVCYEISSTTVSIYYLSQNFDYSTSYYGRSYNLSQSVINGLALHHDNLGFSIITSNVEMINYRLPLPHFFNNTTEERVIHDLTGFDTSPQSFRWSDDGFTLFVIGVSTDNIIKYTTEQPYSLSGLTQTEDSFSLAFLDSSIRDFDWSADGRRLIVAGYNSLKIYELVTDTPFMLNTLRYEDVSLNFSSRYPPTAVEWSSDGLRLLVHRDYTSSSTSKIIIQYSNSTPYSLQGLSTDTSFDISSTDNDVKSVRWNNDGSKLFVTGNQFDRVYEFSALDNFNISGMTANSFDKFIDLKTFGGSSVCFDWVSDGDKFMVLDSSSATLYSLNSNTNYQLSTTTYNNISRNIAGYETNIMEFRWSNDGMRGWFIGTTNDSIYQFSVTDPFNISTASSFISFLLSTYDTLPSSFVWATDGMKLFVVGQATDRIYQFSTSEAFNISQLTYDNVSIPVNGQSTVPTSIGIKNTGDKIYLLDATTDGLYEYHLAEVNNISGMTYTGNNINLTSQESNPISFKFNNDGTKLYVIGTSTDTVYEYNIEIPYDIKRAKFTFSTFRYTQGGSPTSIEFSSDGNKLFISDNSNETIFSYDLPSPYDLNGFSYDNDNYSLSEVGMPLSAQWGKNGKSLFVISNTTKSLHEYETTADYSVSGMTHINNSFLLSPIVVTPMDFIWSNDGIHLIVLDGNQDILYQFSTTNAYDITKLSYTGLNFRVGSVETTPTSLSVNNDGTKIYLTGTNSDRIHQFRLTTPYTLNEVIYEGQSNITIGNTPYGLEWNSDGSKLMVNDNSIIYVYTVNTPFDVADIELTPNRLQTTDSGLENIFFNDNGTKIYSISDSNRRINEYSLDEPYVIKFINIEGVYDWKKFLNTSKPFYGIWSDIGDKYFTMQSNVLLEYGTNENFNTSGMTFNDKTYTLPTTMSAIKWSNDGSKLYGLSSYTSSTQTLYEINCDSTFDTLDLFYNNKNIAITNYLRDFVFNNDGTKMVFLRTISNTTEIRQYTLINPYDITTRQYDTMVTIPNMKTGITLTWSRNGRIMFIAESDTDAIYEFTVNTPFDIRGLIPTNNVFYLGYHALSMTNVNTELIMLLNDGHSTVLRYSLNDDNSLDRLIPHYNHIYPQEEILLPYLNMSWTDLGRKVYFTDINGDKIYQYQATNPYSLNGLIFISERVDTNDLRDIIVSPDGKLMLGISRTNRNVYLYEFTTPYDVNSLLPIHTLTISTVYISSAINGIGISNDGKKMILNDTSDAVCVVTLSEPYDISQVQSYSGRSTYSKATSPMDMTVSSDGKSFFVLHSSLRTIYKFDMVQVFDPTCLAWNGEFINLSNTFGNFTPESIHLHPDGDKLYVTYPNEKKIRLYKLPKRHSVTPQNTLKSISLTSQDNSIRSSVWSNDGLVMYASGNQNGRIYEYRTLSEFNLEGLTYEGVNFEVTSTPTSLSFNDDGTKFYFYDSNTSGFYEYQLQTQFRLNGMVLTDTQTFNGYSVRWADHGTRLFVTTNIGVESYTAQVPYSFSGVTYVDSMELNESVVVDAQFSDVFWSPDGYRMFVMSFNTNSIYQYITPTPFSFVGMVFENVIFTFDGTPNNGATYSFSWKPDLSKMYVVSSTTSTVVEYEMNAISQSNYNVGNFVTTIDITNDMVNPPRTVLISALSVTPLDSTIRFRISDINGGSEVVVNQVEFEKEVNVLSLNTKKFKVVVELIPSSNGTQSPVLDDYSIYFQ